ncbi:MAG: nitronate monooxygenase [Chloroflexi bacterium]|nr:nitronate monooxygenase [Chloroflexota bacterium]
MSATPSGVLRTPLCDLLGIEHPVLQAGMGKSKGLVTSPALVAAVSEAGGLGCLGGTGLDPEELRETIRELRRLTSRPFAVDLLLPAKLAAADQSLERLRALLEREYPAHVRFVERLRERYALPKAQLEREYMVSEPLIRQQVAAVLDERVPVFVAGLGDPAEVVPEAHARGMLVVGIAGSVRNAVRQRAAGVDLVIAQGHEAGGHTGAIASLVLVPQVVDALRPLPVVAAGGIADGRGVAAALVLGAVGVWCGTVFLFAEEAWLDDAHRRQLDAAGAEDLVVSRTYTGKTARVYRNEVVAAWAQSGLEPLPMPLQWALMSAFVAAAEAAGREDLATNPAGQVAGTLRGLRPARQIVAGLVDGARQAIGRLGDYTRTEARRGVP